jgi:hypothetical protein
MSLPGVAAVWTRSRPVGSVISGNVDVSAAAGGARASAITSAANIGDPATIAVDPADWNGTSLWTYFTGADLDSQNSNPVDQFHTKKKYSNSGLMTNGECGQDQNGDPYPFVCSGFYQSELIAIQPNDLIDANYVGSLYSSSAKAAARYQDATTKNGKGTSCGLSSAGISHCMIWAYYFTNSQGQKVAFGAYTVLQVGNALGETVNFMSWADYNNGNGSKFRTFLHDTVDLLDGSAGELYGRSNGGKVAITSPLATAVPFSFWPAENVSKGVFLKPADADKTNLNPLTAFHGQTYTKAGMLANGNCGTDSNSKPLPKKCGGVLEQEIVPIGVVGNNTQTTTYVGTLYGSPAKALAQLKNSKAANGAACPFTVNGSPVPSCKVVATTFTNGSGQKQERLYGEIASGNALGEVLTTAKYSDYTNKSKHAAIIGSFDAVLYGAATTL